MTLSRIQEADFGYELHAANQYRSRVAYLVSATAMIAIAMLSEPMEGTDIVAHAKQVMVTKMMETQLQDNMPRVEMAVLQLLGCAL